MKTVLITGSARGIGAATAALFADSGYNVVINYNTSEKEALTLLEYITDKGCNAIAVRADVSDPQEAERLLRCLADEPLWFKAAVYLALLLALRREEVIGACESAIDWANQRIDVTKTVTQQSLDGKSVITEKPSTKGKKVKSLKLISPLDQLIQELIDEHAKNKIIFGNPVLILSISASGKNHMKMRMEIERR